MTPNILRDKLETAYVWFANAVASEDPGTANHAKRLKIAREIVANVPSFDHFIIRDMTAQGFTDDTAQGDFNNRLSGLATNLVNLGFGD